jgi:cytochrome P450
LDSIQYPHGKTQLIRESTVRLNPTISDEVLEAMALELPQGSDWTEVNINSKLLRIVAMVSGRVFVGPELCRDEAYLDASINYTTDLMIAVHVVALVPKFLRSLISPHLPPVKKLQQRIREADEFLRPIVAKRIEAAKQPGYEKPDDMLQWIIESQKKFGDKGDKELAKMQLGISFAAIHTTTLTTTNA